MDKTFTGKADDYKVNVVKTAINDMKNDEWNLTRLQNEKGKAINIDMNLMEIILNYFEGKTISIKD